MNNYSFVLLLSGRTELDADVEDALASAGCTDATLRLRNGVLFLDFDREAASAAAALTSAVREVESTGLGLRVVRAEPDDFVSQAEIARRLDKPRETIRLWIEARRGPGGFPAPCSGITGRSLTWRWSEVAEWLTQAGHLHDARVVELGRAIATLNGALELREHAPDFRRALEQLSA